MLEFIHNWLVNQGLHAATAMFLARSVAIILVIILSILANYVAKRIILLGVRYSAGRTATKWDDMLVKRGVFNRLANFAPALVIYLMLPLALAGYGQLITVVQNATLVCMIVVGVLAIDAFLNTVSDIYQTFEVSQEIPIRSPMQVLKIIIYFFGIIFIISAILNKTPIYLMTGLGALSAVLMLIFKDSILGFVAGIQLTANKMVAPGDWVEMPKYNADGDVLEVGLTTVKVQNWDKTITMIPTYALISESFKNWRGMQRSGGRRIKRSISIDISSIKFCTEEMLARFSKIQYISEYIERKKKEIGEHNAALKVDEAILVNGRHLTNVGTFRAYVVAYLKNQPMINQEMTFLVRQLAPTEQGLPIQIYVFSKDKVWVNYEAIQADIFDHLLAVVAEFDLRVFQDPTEFATRGVVTG
ncbi:mechanosensitive ion channel domain-containing protein [Chloroflexota bacterium]